MQSREPTKFLDGTPRREKRWGEEEGEGCARNRGRVYCSFVTLMGILRTAIFQDLYIYVYIYTYTLYTRLYLTSDIHHAIHHENGIDATRFRKCELMYLGECVGLFRRSPFLIDLACTQNWYFVNIDELFETWLLSRFFYFIFFFFWSVY